MKVFFHYCTQGFSNCYILGRIPKKQMLSTSFPHEREALLIDPGCMDETILAFIEKGEYNLKGVLITHNHENHVRGLRALMRIYNTEVYAMQPDILDFKTNIVRDGDSFSIGSYNIEVISVPGHSSDSVIYKIEHFLFTGDAISAGMMGAVPSPYGAMRQIAKIQNTIFPLRGNFIIFPGHGPPSSLSVERKYNIDIGHFQDNRNKTERTWYDLDLLD